MRRCTGGKRAKRDAAPRQAFTREAAPRDALIHVEAAEQLRLRVGGAVYSTKHEEAIIFRLANGSTLRLRILDRNYLQVGAKLIDRNDIEVLRVVENHVRVARDSAVRFDSQPGHARIVIPATEQYIAPWVFERMDGRGAELVSRGEIVALDLEVFWLLIIFRAALSITSAGAAVRQSVSRVLLVTNGAWC